MLNTEKIYYEYVVGLDSSYIGNINLLLGLTNLVNLRTLNWNGRQLDTIICDRVPQVLYKTNEEYENAFIESLDDTGIYDYCIFEVVVKFVDGSVILLRYLPPNLQHDILGILLKEFGY